ncbi:hypothetical protein [Nodularia sp. NIES-3585]|nr:hypothetical protein [Nodularia sp. NIES-3585]GAX37752.1 putative transposase [Nodularia sp. NIES-3585]
MIVLEFKVQGKTTQYAAMDEAIRTAQICIELGRGGVLAPAPPN